MTYRTIVIDPPWQVKAGREIGDYIKAPDGSQPFGVRCNKARSLAYPAMSLDQMALLPIPALADDDAHLYLWTINRYLRQAFDLLDMWGFHYSTTLVWAKQPMGGGLGGSYGLAAEYALFARRGNLSTTSRIGRNWWSWKRPYDKRGKPKHSAKPPAFYDLVQSVSPGPYLEMFAREKREGWHVWGNEVMSDIEVSV